MELSFDKLPEAVERLSGKVDILIERVNALSNSGTPNENQHELLDLQSAAKMVGKAPSTLYTMTSKRQIPFHKRGNKLYFFKDELTAWIETSDQAGLTATEADFEQHLAQMQSGKRRKAAAQYSPNKSNH